MSVSLVDGHIDGGMTDNEIIKALECCLGYSCSSCPCEKGASILCLDDLHRYTLDFINRQKAEIERLQIVHNCIDKAILGNREFAIADEYLIAYRGALKQLYDNTKIRAEAYKECIEKAKEILHNYCIELVDDDLDNLVKEMVGEG